MTVRPDPLVRCTDVARTYGSGRAAVVAVHGVSCEVNAGEGVARWMRGHLQRTG